LCSICGERIFGHHFTAESGALCGACRLAAPRFRKAAAFGPYEGVLRDIIHIFKYQRIKSAGPLLGRLLGQAYPAIQAEDPVLVVPVPLWPGKRRDRGFNQAEEIARAFLRSGASRGIQLCTTLLIRSRETAPQTGLTRRQRQANLRGAFAVTEPENVQRQSILLVDDVMTTGATAGECARVLLRAGAKQVYVATVARATREAASILITGTTAQQGPRAVATAVGSQSGGIPGHA
jgi:ComF family protein